MKKDMDFINSDQEMYFIQQHLSVNSHKGDR